MKKLQVEIPARAKKSLGDLHQLFPERSVMLVSALRERNKKDKKLPEWRSEQIAKLAVMVIQSAMDLEPAYLSGRISALAWATRNLLELSIWIDYCNLSDQHAKRFSDDSLRDLYGLSKAVQQTFEVGLVLKAMTLTVPWAIFRNSLRRGAFLHWRTISSGFPTQQKN